jgi:hypothetical protein
LIDGRVARFTNGRGVILFVSPRQEVGLGRPLLFPHRGYKPKSLAGNSADQALRFPAVSNRMPDSSNPAADRGFRDNAAAPDHRDQLVFAYNAFAVGDKILQKIKDLGLDRDQLGSAPELPAVSVQ